MSAARLELVGVTKAFPGVVALDNVSLAVSGGEIRALVGENGAGKSTLLKILSGEHAPDAGAIRIDGAARSFAGPHAAAAAGVAVIHQELQLVPELSVEGNLLLGVMPTRGPFVDRKAMRATALGVLERLGEPIDPETKCKDLSIGRRQMVEIGKALLRKANIIAFDEPTSSLSARETATLMRLIRDLKAEGRTILYVSHRMEEVFSLCDSVSVLRDGRSVFTGADIKSAGEDRVITEMAGRAIRDIYGYSARPVGEVALEARALTGPGLTAPASFAARRGEILGFFGLIGAGRSELFRLIYGARRVSGGTLNVNGAARAFAGPSEAIEAGLALCPEDRKDEGILPLMSVRENVAAAKRARAGQGVFRNARDERAVAREAIAGFKIKTASAEATITTLSGGNQQKVVLARGLAAGADILLMDEPTRGIDVGARSEIYALLYRFAEEGKAILMASSDMAEVLGVCDRIIVMREGRIVGDVPRAEATQDQLMRLALPDARAVA